MGLPALVTQGGLRRSLSCFGLLRCMLACMGGLSAQANTDHTPTRIAKAMTLWVPLNASAASPSRAPPCPPTTISRARRGPQASVMRPPRNTAPTPVTPTRSRMRLSA